MLLNPSLTTPRNFACLRFFPVCLWHRQAFSVFRLPFLISAENLDAASWLAVETMRQIVIEQLGVDADTARLLVGVLGNVRISQIVNPLKTVRVDMPLVKCEDRWVIHRIKCCKEHNYHAIHFSKTNKQRGSIAEAFGPVNLLLEKIPNPVSF